MLQNLLCLWKKKTQVVFFVFYLEQLSFSLMNALVYVDIANFEAFLLVFKLTKNLFFLKSERQGNEIQILRENVSRIQSIALL